MIRNLRRLSNSIEQTQSFNEGGHSSLQEGGSYITIENGRLAIYRKHKGLKWKSYMASDGNQYVDKKLTTNSLEYTNTFIDYRIYKHNFSDNIGTTEHFLPWQGAKEGADMDVAEDAFLVPFKMTCHKILFRPEAFSTPTADFTFKIKRQDSGDATVDEVASFTYTDTFADNTTIEVRQSDFNNTPVVNAGAKASISIQANANPHGSSKDYYITSVWRTEITI
tara:strand:+ start:3427 stop:4095 length:669 start_codon:yes stop_codon:yes gene_type:complete